MRYLSLAEIVNIHRLITDATGGASGIRDLAALESVIGEDKVLIIQDTNQTLTSALPKMLPPKSDGRKL
jgi:prophage maintenance system killer protein